VRRHIPTASAQARSRKEPLCHASIDFAQLVGRAKIIMRVSSMNRDIIEGNWKQVKGKIKARWGKLTDDELDQIEGDYDMLCGRIQKAYGLSRDEAERKLQELH
jgi:uncharacterized protein YjbJ (UPF0337 family)